MLKIGTKAMISYAWKDKEVVRPLVEKLRRMNVRVWIDTNNMADNINESMIEGIRHSAAVVAFLSDSYVESHNCKLEIKFANDIRKPIVPVHLSSSKAIQYSAAAFVTAGQLYVDLQKGVTSTAHEQIAARLFKLSRIGLDAVTIPDDDVVVFSNQDNLLGEGSFGKVHKGLFLSTIPVAVKALKLTVLSDKTKNELINEANILQRSRRPFVIGFHGVLQADEVFSLVLELAALGSLASYYEDPANSGTTIHQRVTILHQVSSGMAYLHDTLKITHNDLKSFNILLTQNLQGGPILSKITDFGMSKLKSETMTKTTTSSTGGGSLLWLAPERRGLRPKISKKNDIYSFAVLMTEVISWVGVFGIPWNEMDVQSVLASLLVESSRQAVLEELKSDIFVPLGSVGTSLLGLFKKCWNLDYKARPIFRDVYLELKGILEKIPTEPVQDAAEVIKNLRLQDSMRQNRELPTRSDQTLLSSARSTPAHLIGSNASLGFAELAATVESQALKDNSGEHLMPN
ncbi:kinase-like domain-containing protein [Zopfochytrium polystomum]|nr:kinase-like domain-containing protein [Zopfochytrium polystomum]